MNPAYVLARHWVAAASVPGATASATGILILGALGDGGGGNDPPAGWPHCSSPYPTSRPDCTVAAAGAKFLQLDQNSTIDHYNRDFT